MNKRLINRFSVILCIMVVIPFMCYGQNSLSLHNEKVKVQWVKTDKGYKIDILNVSVGDNRLVKVSNLLGKYTVLYSEGKPSTGPEWSYVGPAAQDFPDSSYTLIFGRWREDLSEVALNTAGKAFNFFPSKAVQTSDSEILFFYNSEHLQVKSSWKLDKHFDTDIMVKVELTANKNGYYSMASPELCSIPKSDIKWGMIPGHFQGTGLNPNLVLSYGYGQGIPDRPVIARERTASTLAPLITTKEGFTIATIAAPGMGRDPWGKNKNTNNDWLLGLSLINRTGHIMPTLYHPVLGEKTSYLQKGEKRVLSFRYSFGGKSWYKVYKHAINDIYRFKNFLALKDTRLSLTNRILGMWDYVCKDSTSLWHVSKYNGLEIGAQEYNAAVVGSDHDARKNSDYGAMWMLANITEDSLLINTRLPYARNFKLAQQEIKDPFFEGSPKGQYYLWKRKRFTEEWGDYVEPIGLTYYTMLDIGNILLFRPEDTVLLKRLRLGADRLLTWQHKAGNWEVAYDKQTRTPAFTDLKDLRPTFYGLVVAYKILGDKKYLRAACRGADWFIKNAVNEGKFLGVCGDFRFVPDFATGQSVQALLDLYKETKVEEYKDAAIRTARIYTASIFTHPIPDRTGKVVNGAVHKDWEISQVGLNFEHGGTLGSAAKSNGPILLASHAGLFVRLFDLTKDSLYLEMARAAAWGRDAFVNKKNSVASYYWKSMHAGPGRFPHHAWWQIGWITDYLLSEIRLRSNDRIAFPTGFIAPKVGPHVTYGFSSGILYGQKVDLFLRKALIELNNPRIDYMGAIDRKSRTLYIVLLNNSTDEQNATLEIKEYLTFLNGAKVEKVEVMDKNGHVIHAIQSRKSVSVGFSPYGLKILKIKYL